MKKILFTISFLIATALTAQQWVFSPEPEISGQHRAQKVEVMNDYKVAWAGQKTSGVADNGSPATHRYVSMHDQEGEQLWERAWVDSICCESMHVLTELSDGNLLAIGNEYIVETAMSPPTFVNKMFKLSGEDGSTMWEAFLDYQAVDAFGLDGEIVVVGTNNFSHMYMEYFDLDGTSTDTLSFEGWEDIRAVDRNSNDDYYFLFPTRVKMRNFPADMSWSADLPEGFFSADLVAMESWDPGCIVHGQNGDVNSNTPYHHEVIKFNFEGLVNWYAHPATCFPDAFADIEIVGDFIWTVGSNCSSGAPAIYRLGFDGDLHETIETNGIAILDIDSWSSRPALAGYLVDYIQPGPFEKEYVSYTDGPAEELIECQLHVPDQTINACPGDAIVLSPEIFWGSGFSQTYFWTPSSGSSDPTALNPVVTPFEAETTYTLTVNDLNGCETSGDFTLIVEQEDNFIDAATCGAAIELFAADFYPNDEEVDWTVDDVTVTASSYIVPEGMDDAFWWLDITSETACPSSNGYRIYFNYFGDCVWPGDANYDGVADNYDLLQVAAGYGETGMARDPQGIEWAAIAAFDYENTIGTTVNAKHADCNGDGSINSDDLGAILANYGSVHARGISSNGPAITLGDAQVATNSICYSINVGEEEASDLLGLALSFDYSPSSLPAEFNAESDMWVQWNATSWLFADAELIELEKAISGETRFDVAGARINGNNASGSGAVGDWCFRVVASMQADDIAGAVVAAEGITADGSPVEFTVESIGSSVEEEAVKSLNLYPNPAGKTLFIERQQSTEAGLKVYDYAGKLLRQTTISGSTVQLDISELSPGMYSIQIDQQFKRFIVR